MHACIMAAILACMCILYTAVNSPLSKILAPVTDSSELAGSNFGVTSEIKQHSFTNILLDL